MRNHNKRVSVRHKPIIQPPVVIKRQWCVQECGHEFPSRTEATAHAHGLMVARYIEHIYTAGRGWDYEEGFEACAFADALIAHPRQTKELCEKVLDALAWMRKRDTVVADKGPVGLREKKK